MRSINPSKVLATLAVAVALGACGSSGLGDIMGSPGGGTQTAAADEVRGTVRYVDTSGDCLIEIEDARWSNRSNLRNDDYGGAYGNNTSGERLTLHCDDRTVVMHEGQSYRPQALERGDEIAARVDQTGNQLRVARIDVLYDATPGDDDRATDDRRFGGGDLRGIVRYVDRDNRTIQLENVDVFDRNLEDYDDDRITLYYDTDTDVEFDGKSYRAENLEPGDEVEVEVYEIRGRLHAEVIEVVSDARTSRY